MNEIPIATPPARATGAPVTRTLRIATYNIRKGVSQLRSRFVLGELRDQLHVLGADLVFLQEVHGRHDRHASRFEEWPDAPQYEFLADTVWPDYAYGKNAVYDHGHHGNAILSRFPIESWDNEDVSAYFFESRGLLHCEIAVPGWSERLHCINVHLGLLQRGRIRQLNALIERIARLVPHSAPLIVAGDFNDWRRAASRELAHQLGVREAFEETRGRPARSYPARLPLLHLDRIYVRGFEIRYAHVHHGRLWARLSDHAALTATLARLP